MRPSVHSLLHPELINGNIVKAMIAFSAPIIVSCLFQQLYNAVDASIVGHYLGERSLAAIGACVAIFELMVGFGLGFGNGLSIVVARAYGAQDEEALKKSVAASIVVTVGVSVLTTILGGLFLRDLLVLLGTPEEILDEAHGYIGLVAAFCCVLFAYNLLSGILRAIGNSFMSLVFLIVSSGLNVLLDVILIRELGMGVRGTAIATVLAQGVSALLCAVYILRKARILIPERRHFCMDRAIYVDLLQQGLSMALMSALVSSGSVILQSSINSFGTLVIAGHVSARKVFGLSVIPLLAFSTACATFVSQNLGAHKYGRIRRGVTVANYLCVAWGILCTLVIPFFSRYLISIMSGSSEEEVLGYGSMYVTFIQPFYGVLGVLVVARNSLQGLGEKMLPLISSFIELVGKILFTYIIVPRTGIWGIIICEPLIWVVMAVQLLYVFWRHPVVVAGKGRRTLSIIKSRIRLKSRLINQRSMLKS